MNWMIMAAASLIPSLVLVVLFVRKDRFPEPTHMILKTFFLGVLIVNPILLAEFAVQEAFSGLVDPVAQAFVQAFLVAALCEEAFKFLVLHKFCATKPDFDEPMDAVVYGAVASLGFATLENILYVVEGGMDVALVRAITAVPAHACFGALMGYFYAQTAFKGGGRKSLILALFVPFLAHGLYDLPLFLMSAPSIADNDVAVLCLFVGFVALVIWLMLRVRKIMRAMRQEQDGLAP
jgi:protease PrsW